MGLQFTRQFALDALQGVHNFATDTFKLALFDNSATFTAASTTYSTTNEVTTGNGYTTGGATLTVTSGYPVVSGNAGTVRFDTVSWTFTVNKTVRWAVTYNTSKSDKIVFFIDMDQVRTLSSLSVTFPLTLDPCISIRIAA